MSDAGVWLGAIFALFCVIAALYAFAQWVRKGLRDEIAETIAPQLAEIHKRIDTHMDDEADGMERIALALELLASHVGVELPR